ncbi:MAG TPA: plastocyanin/azurin family copper-binding protein [Candidatus Limnocylindria bacterium]
MTGSRLLATTLLAVLVAAVATGCGRVAGQEPVTLQITIHYSQFEETELTVPHGVPVTFVLVNEDPIEHEWLIGDAAFHERHRSGTEGHHGARPNEISLKPLETMRTTLIFDEPGTILYICHLPRHEAYGMVGTLTVT